MYFLRNCPQMNVTGSGNEATSHYLNQCWPRSPTPYGVTKPQWVKIITDDVLAHVTRQWNSSKRPPHQGGLKCEVVLHRGRNIKMIFRDHATKFQACAFLLRLFQSQKWFNSLCPSDAMWRHRSGSTLAQVMAWCLMAPSHYLNQYWLIVSGVLWHWHYANFTGEAHDIYPWHQYENY